ncbi:MAG TPA: hypothetical protein VLX64_01780 [Thermoplasmata archaeon]|nr:hypothetical protein [Thermoplasmata archaeon]HUJ77716.1 hypothetical protein [Thermoplasmata archaeon]
MANPSRSASRWPPPTYVVRVRFRAPLSFVFDWCTDYTAKDAELEGEGYERRVISRSKSEVVYEDLEDQDGGWFWTRHVVRLRRPRHWHSDSIGSHRAYSLDYDLTPLGPAETELVLTAKRRPYGHGGPNPSKTSWERSVAKSWKHFAKFLERDYRASRDKVSRTP